MGSERDTRIVAANASRARLLSGPAEKIPTYGRTQIYSKRPIQGERFDYVPTSTTNWTQARQGVMTIKHSRASRKSTRINGTLHPAKPGAPEHFEPRRSLFNLQQYMNDRGIGGSAADILRNAYRSRFDADPIR
jgi:hypothetical protein